MMQLLNEELVNAHHVQHLRLLIVAANGGDVLEVAAVLRSRGALAAIEHAADHSELTELLERFVPDVVLTRFADAGVDGMAVLAAVQGAASRVPVVMLCEDGDANVAADALRWGAAACVRRSDWPRLDRVVRDALESGSHPWSRTPVDERPGTRETGYRLLVEATAQIVWHADSDGRVCEVSEAFWRYTGLDRSAGPNVMWDLALHPDDRIPAQLRWTECVATGEPFRIECRFVQTGGHFRFFEVRALPMAAANGRKARWIGLCMDIDHRKRAVIALQEANRMLQALSRRLLVIQEAERAAVARELHDQVGQSLTAVKLMLERLPKQDRGNRPQEVIGDCVATVNDALSIVRTMAVDLRPPQLDTIGLADAIGSYCSRLETVSRVPIKVTCDGPLEPVPPEVGTACFRIAQEALINVLRHARATSAEVLLARRGRELELVVRDDGCGFDVAAARSRAVRGSSIGLLGIDERAALAGGTVTVHSVHGSGTTVAARFWLPLERRASKEGA